MSLEEQLAPWHERATAADRRNARIDVLLALLVGAGMVAGLLVVANTVMRLVGTPREPTPVVAIVIALIGLAPSPILRARTRDFRDTFARLRGKQPRSSSARQNGVVIGRAVGRLFYPVIYLLVPVTWMLVWGFGVAMQLSSTPLKYRIAIAVRTMQRTEAKPA